IKNGTGQLCRPKASHRRSLQRSLKLSVQRRGLFINKWDRLRSTALHAPVCRVENLLILPAFLAGDRERLLTFNRLSEGIHLPSVGRAVRYRFCVRDRATAL